MTGVLNKVLGYGKCSANGRLPIAKLPVVTDRLGKNVHTPSKGIPSVNPHTYLKTMNTDDSKPPQLRKCIITHEGLPFLPGETTIQALAVL